MTTPTITLRRQEPPRFTLARLLCMALGFIAGLLTAFAYGHALGWGS